MSSMQLVEIVILAALAGIVIYNLYTVLGRRMGRQPQDGPARRGDPAAPPAEGAGADAALAGSAPAGLAGIAARDSQFDQVKFLQGARTAYETIVCAFAAGDRETLKGLLAPDVDAGFEAAIAQREAEGRTSSAQFTHPPRADIEGADLEGDLAEIKVRFLAEFRSRSTGAEGEAVEDRRTAEVWTFARNLTSADPNWTLARVDAAEA